jgi:NADP-dependent 3-hydroxy acid dehydrogenase YdfG
LCEAILASGDWLVATARDPDKLADLAESHGDRISTLALDVTDAEQAKASDVLAAIERSDQLRQQELERWRSLSASTDFPRES